MERVRCAAKERRRRRFPAAPRTRHEGSTIGIPASIAAALTVLPPAQVVEGPPAVPPAIVMPAPSASPIPPVLPTPPAGELAAPVQGTVPPPVQAPAAPAEGEVVVVGRDRRGDPLGGVNEQSFEATQAVDRAVFGPAALTYRKQVPRPIRSGIRNFIWNLREPVVALNFLLQHKVGKAFETVGRFAINTTLGVAGLFDAAKKKPFRLPRRRNGFANTMGFYGVKPGAYMFLPLIGSTTVRDLVGLVADQTLVPVGPLRLPGGSASTVPLAVLSALDFRAEFDEELEALRAQKRPYVALRDFYLQRRQAEIDALKGKRPYPPPPTKSLGVILDPDAAAQGTVPPDGAPPVAPVAPAPPPATPVPAIDPAPADPAITAPTVDATTPGLD